MKEQFSWNNDSPEHSNVNAELDSMGKRLSVLWDCAVRLPGGKHEFQCRHGLTVMQFMVKNGSDTELIAIHEQYVKLLNSGVDRYEAGIKCLE